MIEPTLVLMTLGPGSHTHPTSAQRKPEIIRQFITASGYTPAIAFSLEGFCEIGPAPGSGTGVIQPVS